MNARQSIWRSEAVFWLFFEHYYPVFIMEEVLKHWGKYVWRIEATPH